MQERFLTIDIGGTSIKATILDAQGNMTVDYVKRPTPESPSPKDAIKEIKALIKDFPEFDKVSVGFPGYTRNGVIYTAPNLGPEHWKEIPFAQMLADELKKPVRLVNDADMQGFGLVSGKGLEMVITLGTGFGTALFLDGSLLPHFELAHLPVKDDKDYDDYVGDDAYEEHGKEKWNKRVKKVLQTFQTVINFDRLYLSGGNSKNLDFKLPDNVTVCGNRDGINGGAFLWAKEDSAFLKTINPKNN